jgi:WhiB family transcriptional regulator, redox-sensing transcriptional regulator
VRQVTAADSFGRLTAERPPGPVADWRDGALCTQTDPEAFFPEQGAATGRALRVARQMCSACPVRTQCLEWALGHGEVLEGIWGGTTERERRRLKRRVA